MASHAVTIHQKGAGLGAGGYGKKYGRKGQAGAILWRALNDEPRVREFNLSDSVEPLELSELGKYMIRFV